MITSPKLENFPCLLALATSLDARNVGLEGIREIFPTIFQILRAKWQRGVNRGDGLRPDGMTRAPWSQGRSLVWDVTVVDTVPQLYVKTIGSTAGAAADQAEEFKMQKYRILSDRYHFKP